MLPISSAVFFLAEIHVVSSLHILMYLTMVGKSHLHYTDKLIEKLAERGHTTDLIIARLNSGVASNGTGSSRSIVSVDFPGGVSPWNKGAVSHLENPFEEAPTWNPFKATFMTGFETITMELCELVAHSPEVSALLSSTKYDLALLPAYDLCAFGVARGFGIHSLASYAATPLTTIQIAYGGNPELPIYENMIIDSLPDSDRNIFAHRVFETIRVLYDRLVYGIVIKKMNAMFAHRFGPNFPDAREIFANTSFDFANSHELLEEPRPISKKMKFIGGVGLPKPNKLNKEFDSLLNHSKKGTILFSFGTQVPSSKIPKDIVKTFVAAFQRFPEYTFIWKHDEPVESNSSNIHCVSWLPQTDLLYDDRVVAFISHTGLNSLTEAAFAGVPVVAIPLFVDQIHNARRAQKLGLGVLIRKTEITVDSVSSALEAVLHDPSYRSRSKEVAKMLRRNPDDPTKVFVESVEFAAAFPNLHKHNTPSAVEFSFMAAHGWDVAVFLAFTATALLILIAALTWKIVRTIGYSVQKAKSD